jgi:hypothetical protein
MLPGTSRFRLQNPSLGVTMRSAAFALLFIATLGGAAAAEDYRITGDYGGSIDEYKARYAAIRDSGKRVVIDGVCNSACTLVFGIVPLSRICVTPRASVGLHMAYYDVPSTDGVRIPSYEWSADVMSLYPESVRAWLRRHGGLTVETKTIKNGPELWEIVDPCPDE